MQSAESDIQPRARSGPSVCRLGCYQPAMRKLKDLTVLPQFGDIDLYSNRPWIKSRRPLFEFVLQSGLQHHVMIQAKNLGPKSGY